MQRSYASICLSMVDYRKLLSPEIWAFIAETEATYPADAATAPVAVQRGYYNALCAKFDRPHPPGIRVEDFESNGVAMRRYFPAKPRGQVLYLHGGGFIVGGLDSHDAVCAEIAAAVQASVLAVDYRLAPEHRHPAALQDCDAALGWLLAHSEGPIVLAGDSAGATLAACLVLNHRYNRRIVGQALIYPWLGTSESLPSRITHAYAPMLTTADLAYYAQIITDPAQPYAVEALFALNEPHCSHLPATFILTAECDPLASDGHIYAERLAEAHGDVELYRGEGLVHGFLRARYMAPEAGAAYSRLLSAISEMLD